MPRKPKFTKTTSTLLATAAFFRRALLLAAIAGGVSAGVMLADQYGGLFENLIPPAAVETIVLDNGGAIDEYTLKYAKWRNGGTRVRLDGSCFSACTMITGLMPKDRVCVTPFARLAFHSAYSVIGGVMIAHSSEGTREMWHSLSPDVRALLIAKGFNGNDKDVNEHREFIYVEGEELLAIYSPCKET